MLKGPISFGKIRQLIFHEYILALGIIFAGILLRLRQYLANRSLWLDEAMLALNIVNKDFPELLKPLDYDQGAPIGFLFLQKSVVLLFGNNEYTLRLVPFLAGITSLFLFYWLLKRLSFGKYGSYFALLMFIFSPLLINYSVEAKQYIVDVFCTIVLLLVAVPVFNVHAKTKQYLVLGTVGVLLFWFSHAVLFVLAGIGVALSLHVFFRDRSKIVQVVGLGAAWIVNLACLYFISLQDLSTNQYLLSYWQDGFMPMPPWSEWNWFSINFISSVGWTLNAIVPLWLSVVMLVLGFFRLFRHKGHAFGVLGVFLFTLLASGLGLYPFLGRMILFLVPVVFLLLGAFIDFIENSLKQYVLIACVPILLCSGYFLYQPIRETGEYFINPKYAEHIRPALDYLEISWRENDALFITYGAIPSFRYYASRYNLEHIDFQNNLYPEYQNPAALLEHFRQYKAGNRLWVLMTHIYEDGDFNEKDYILTYLDSIGKKRRTHIVTGTSVYLYLYVINP